VTSTTQGPPTSGAVELLSTLYPPPLEVRTGARRTTRAWAAVPSPASPRLLVPLGSRRAMARVVRRQLTGRRPRTRVVREVLSLAAATGLLRLPHFRVGVVGGDGHRVGVEEVLGEVLGRDDLALTLPVGPPRANRKPVLQVTDTAGRVLAFAKVGDRALTRSLVRREAEALAFLEQHDLPHVRAPRLLGHREWDGHAVLVQEALHIPTDRLTGDAAHHQLLAVVRDVAGTAAGVPVAWADHPYRAELESRLADLERTRGGDDVAGLRAHAEALPPHLPLGTAAWHGDLNPGNVALVGDTSPVWDWERYETGVVPGLDLLHHELHAAITVHGVTPRDAASALLDRAPATLDPLGLHPVAADVVARVHLLTLGCRYLADDQRAAGGDLGRIGEWLLPALAEGGR
jgi:hypothetical protein